MAENTQTKIKDPHDVLDYAINWQGDPAPFLLPGETITLSVWVMPQGITKDSDTHTSTTATIWVSGGTAGQTYHLVNRITTSGGRTKDEYLNIRVKDV